MEVISRHLGKSFIRQLSRLVIIPSREERHCLEQCTIVPNYVRCENVSHTQIHIGVYAVLYILWVCTKA